MELLSEREGMIALCLARKTIEKQIRGGDLECEELSSVFDEKRGVFVTITEKGELRGCIGLPYPMYPLKEGIVEAAISASTSDPRFPPVSPEELDMIRLEVTILTNPERLECLPEERPENIVIGRDGLIIKGFGRSGLLLPQVAKEYNMDPVEFLDHVCMKAGLPTGMWRSGDVEIMTFRGQIFTENK
ncbi:TIGR00296 family protein [Methanolacinia paynteri]|uniref:TIGR00296 family protein n=1 Tax=Methanolacinia paynteri TaxID=230356 RepID=UPI00064EE13A|nr:TIGR00296 family protein [Methanolacinia paynteri]